MKKIIVFLAFFSFTIIGKAQTWIDSKITDVTVYRQNAQITAAAKTPLKAGTSEIVIENVSTSIIPLSMQVALSAQGKVTLLSAKYEPNYLQSPKKIQK